MQNKIPGTLAANGGKIAKESTLATKAKGKSDHAIVQRRDATGHLNPEYAAGLRALHGETEPTDTPAASAFLHGMRSEDPLAEQLGEAFVRTALSGEDTGEDDNSVIEEIGGPFVETTGRDEFATGTDPSNPATATREPIPIS